MDYNPVWGVGVGVGIPLREFGIMVKAIGELTLGLKKLYIMIFIITYFYDFSYFNDTQGWV